MEPLSVAVVGAAGLVGRELLDVIEERGLPVRALRLLGSLRTAGADLERDRHPPQRIELLGPSSFDGVDLVFFSAGRAVAGEHAPRAAEAGAAVIDLSSRFRLDETVPLVVPEVNAETITERRESGIVASPSATTVALSVVLAPIAAAAGIRRVVVATYQGAAGGGRRAMNGLSRETLDLLNARGMRKALFGRRRAFNVVPEVGKLVPGGASTHELGIVEETRKVLGDPGLAMSVTAVRVPVFFGHAMSVHLETEQPLGAAGIADVVRGAPGLMLHHSAEDAYPTPLEVAGSDATHVGRLRDDLAGEHGVAFWVALDNVRKGGALNAVEIAEILVRDHL